MSTEEDKGKRKASDEGDDSETKKPRLEEGGSSEVEDEDESGGGEDNTSIVCGLGVKMRIVKDGKYRWRRVMQCLRPQAIDGRCSSPGRMAEELSRCLHEPKYQLLLKVVQVLGADKALQLFEETAQIQKDGGKPTAQGNRKKSPGGVFLTLVKTCATAEQNKQIFKIDKEITARRGKIEKKRKAKKRWKKEHQRELAVVKQKAEWELQIFRAQLGDDFETDKGEAMEVEAIGSPDLALAEERLAAEEFECMNENDLDFGIDLA